MDKHISLARELGYEGQELRDYLKRQQDLEREERLAQREYEKEKREAEQKDKERVRSQLPVFPSYHILMKKRIRWIVT